jgi:hypothetical protein
MGLLSRVKRQLDVQLVSPTDYEALTFECKDHARPVDVEVVDAFTGKLRDIGAHRGAIVSNSGYTRAALNMAEGLGIDTLILVDTQDPGIQTKLFVSVSVRDVYVKDVGLLVSPLISSGQVPARLSGLTLFDATGKQETGARVFAAAWNAQAVSRAPGNQVITFETLGYPDYLRVDGSVAHTTELPVGIVVSERCWVGQLEILKSEGLYDVRTHAYETRSLTTEPLDVTDLPSWTEIPCHLTGSLAVTMEVEVATPLVVAPNGLAAL